MISSTSCLIHLNAWNEWHLQEAIYVCSNAQGVADVINKSRAFMSSTAKAKTAKLSKHSLPSLTTTMR